MEIIKREIMLPRETYSITLVQDPPFGFVVDRTGMFTAEAHIVGSKPKEMTAREVETAAKNAIAQMPFQYFWVRVKSRLLILFAIRIGFKILGKIDSETTILIYDKE